MPFLKGRVLGTLALVLTLGAVLPVAQAQAPPPARTDPQVRAILSQIAAAHKALKGLSANLAVRSQGGGGTESQTIVLAFQKPRLARISITGKTGPLMQAVSDGKTITVYLAHDKKYLKQPLPAGTPAIPAVLAQAPAQLAHILANPAILTHLLTQPGLTMRVGKPGMIGGVPTQTLVATIASQSNPGGSAVVITLAAGAADHLLRRLTVTATMSQNGQPKTFTHTETVTALTLNPALTAAAFFFLPPPGAKKVASLEPPMYDPRLKRGAAPFPIAAKDLSGQALTLSQYRGRVVLLDFWATWCGPCVGEMPDVIAAYKKYHARGFDIVGISLDHDRGQLTSFIRQKHMPWRQVFDGRGWQSAVPRRYGVSAIPFALLLGRDGRIAAVEVSGPQLPAAIQQALTRK